MIAAIAGDIIGSVYEGSGPQPKTFPLFARDCRFTDDTVLTVAVASAIRLKVGYASALRQWGRRYPAAGYGGLFHEWLWSDSPRPYHSYGNGSAMRVSAIGWAYDDLDALLAEAARSAEVTHDHPEGIKGAQAVAGAVLLGRQRRSKEEIRTFLSEKFGYDCSRSMNDLRRHATFDVTCQGTIPAAAVAFLESTGVEDAIRNAVSLGGDTDTLACITGAMAEPHYGGTPESIQREVMRRLDAPLREETLAFARAYAIPVIHDEQRP